MIKLYIGYHKYKPEGKNVYYLEDTVKVKAFFSHYSIKKLISKYKDENYSIFHRDENYDYIIKEYNSIEELEYEYIEYLIWDLKFIILSHLISILL